MEHNQNGTQDICSLCDCLEDVTFVPRNPLIFKHHRLGDCLSKREKQLEYFHKWCPSCSDTPTDLLCGRCKHMRLKHLLQCLLLADPEPTEDLINLEKFYLNLGSVRDLREYSSYCELCGMFAKMADRLVKSTGCSQDSLCVLNVERRLGSLTDVKYTLKFNVSLQSPMDLEKKLSHCDRSETFLGTLDPVHGHSLVSVRTPKATVDWGRVSEWLKECQSRCCYVKPESTLTSEFRVIDVKKRCITLALAPCEYAALSYVWGASSTQLQATTENIHRLSVEGSLSSNTLPQVIDDAIVACSILGIGYLWVDRLCILQDEEPSKKSQYLDAMGEIYSHSFLTLVALDGSDADHGLTGVGKVQRPAYWTGQCQGIHLISQVPDYDDFLNQSKWASRGWTLQEAMFSSRLLFFSDTRVFYECRHRQQVQDEIYGMVPKWSRKGSHMKHSYNEVVLELTQRDLTFESDILHAFRGILHTRWGLDYYGLPRKIFSDAILWTVDHHSQFIDPPKPTSYDVSLYGSNKTIRIHEHPARRAASGDVFPSWSWSSINGVITVDPVSHQVSPSRIKVRTSLATWAVPPTNGRPIIQLLSNATGVPEGFDEREEFKALNERDEQEKVDLTTVIESASQEGNEDQNTKSFKSKLTKLRRLNNRLQDRSEAYVFSRVAAVLAWKSGCFSGCLPTILDIDGTWKEYEDIVSSNWRSLAQFCDEAHCMPNGIMSEHDIEARFPSHMWSNCPVESIFVYTQSVPLDLILMENDTRLHVKAGELVLELMPDSVNMERIKRARHQSPRVVFNLLALSILPCSADSSTNDEDVWYDSAGEQLGLRRPENIRVELMVVETENGISRRVALAWTFLKRWIRQKPRFDTFHLV